MGQGATLTNDELFKRAEKVQRDAAVVGQQFCSLRDLRTLDRDLREVARKLASSIAAFERPGTADGLQRLLIQAEDMVLDPADEPFID